MKLDYSKGLYWQMLNLNLSWDEYITFINEPKHLVNPIRDVILFENPFLELFTKSPWWLIPIAYILPYFFHMMNNECDLTTTILLHIIGVINWTLFEYLIHRFFFHSEDYWLPNHPIVLAHHFLLHGIHHAFPMDRYRLVLPPIVGYALYFFLIFTPIKAIAPAFYFDAM